jgi:hypothetical protein
MGRRKSAIIPSFPLECSNAASTNEPGTSGEPRMLSILLRRLRAPFYNWLGGVHTFLPRREGIRRD